MNTLSRRSSAREFLCNKENLKLSGSIAIDGVLV